MKKNNPYQSRPRNHALFLLAGLLIMMFMVRSGRIQEQGASNLGAPAAVETSTIAVTPTDNKALAPMRSGLLLSRAGDGHGFWTGFMLVERDRPELQPLFRTPFGDGRISDESFTDIAPGAHALTWWSLGRASRASVPVITRIKLEGATTNVHSLEVTPSQAVSCASIAEGKACAIALKKDSYWQLAISSQDRGEIERTVLSSPGKELPERSETLPLIAVPMETSDHLMLFSRNPAALHIMIVMAGRVVGHNRLPLDFEPQAASTYTAGETQGLRTHLLVAGRRAAQDIIVDFTCNEQGLEATERGRFEQDVAAPQGIASVFGRVRLRDINGFALAYRDLPALRVIHTNPDQRNQTMSTIFFPPGNLQSGEATLGTPTALPFGPYWLAAPYSSVMADGKRETCLLLVDEFGKSRTIERSGTTTALMVMETCLLWAVRGADGSGQLIPLRLADFNEGQPLALPALKSGEIPTERLAGEQWGSKRVY